MLHNPEFYKNENLRISNFQTPRFIHCFVEDLEHLHLPRGLAEQAAAIVAQAGSRLEVDDVRLAPDPIELDFHGELRDEQAHAVQAMEKHELGVLEAPPGAGKTVMACALIAAHSVPTLVLVDRKPLLEQWHRRLTRRLDVEAGQIGAGKNNPTGLVDIAMLQTITRSDDPAALLDGYGLIVIDECHHVPAPTVERAVRTLPTRRWLGLTATPHRSDGLKEIMIMQCGPIRHRLKEPDSSIDRKLIVHSSSTTVDAPTDALTRGEVFALSCAAVVEDDQRTEQIVSDVAAAMGRGRNCLVLSGRTEHVEILAAALREQDLEPLVLYGSLPIKVRRDVHEKLEHGAGQVLLVATDRYIGEGFDCPRLDTLFMTFPVSAKSRIIQYAGRILRPLPGKGAVEVHDYVDSDAPMLASIYRKRLAGYRQLGFTPGPAPAAQAPPRRDRTPPRSPDPAPAQVRDWARGQGLPVADRGRIRPEVWQAYRAAHQ